MMSRLTSEQINYQFLLLRHMVCADKQIHSEEAKVLRELSKNTNIETRTIEEMEKIERIKKESRNSQEYLLQEIKVVFKYAFDTIHFFAEENWDTDENNLNSRWENRLKILKLQDTLNNVFEESGKKFNYEVKEILEEIGTELQIAAKLGTGSFKLNGQDSIIFKDILRIGGNLLGIAGAITIFFAAPVGIFLGIAGTVLNVISNFLKSKEQKRREAVENIRNSLNNQLEDDQRPFIK